MKKKIFEIITNLEKDNKSEGGFGDFIITKTKKTDNSLLLVDRQGDFLVYQKL